MTQVHRTKLSSQFHLSCLVGVDNLIGVVTLDPVVTGVVIVLVTGPLELCAHSCLLGLATLTISNLQITQVQMF